MNLLESAGFSRSNPYYIVKQGKVLQIFLMVNTDKKDCLVSTSFMFMYVNVIDHET